MLQKLCTNLWLIVFRTFMSDLTYQSVSNLFTCLKKQAEWAYMPCAAKDFLAAGRSYYPLLWRKIFCIQQGCRFNFAFSGLKHVENSVCWWVNFSRCKVESKSSTTPLQQFAWFVSSTSCHILMYRWLRLTRFHLKIHKTEIVFETRWLYSEGA